MFRIAGCGTKKPMSTKIPAAIEIRSGISRFMRSASLGGEELGQTVVADGQQRAPGHDDQDEKDLDRIGRLEAPEKLRVLGEIRARGVVLLADERVVARDHEEGKLVHVRSARDLDGSGLMPRLGRSEEHTSELQSPC